VRVAHGGDRREGQAADARRFTRVNDVQVGQTATMPAMNGTGRPLVAALFNRRMLICIFTGFS